VDDEHVRAISIHSPTPPRIALDKKTVINNEGGIIWGPHPNSTTFSIAIICIYYLKSVVCEG
jgi:hypothetical protein